MYVSKYVCGQKSNLWPLDSKKFDNFNKSHYLCFMHLNKFFGEGVRKFHQTLKGVHKTRGLRTLVYSGECDGKTMANCGYVRILKDADLRCRKKKKKH